MSQVAVRGLGNQIVEFHPLLWKSCEAHGEDTSGEIFSELQQPTSAMPRTKQRSIR